MRNRGLTVRHIAATALTVLLLTGCAQTKDFLTGSSTSESSDGDVGILGAPEAEHYLAELQRLAGGDPATQAEIFADAQSGFQLTPGPQTNLRYALVLATPGHPEFDPDVAASMLREVLARTELLTQAEIALATIYLKTAEQIAVTQAEIQRLRGATSRAAQNQESATNQRLAAIEAENRRLRRELDEAEQKLEAITSIERSIREQE
jgi:hypothetical protein